MLIGVEGDVEYLEVIDSYPDVASLVGLVAVEGAETCEGAVGLTLKPGVVAGGCGKHG